MHIAIHAGGIPFNGNTIPSGRSLGGSESAAYYMARELARLNHNVVVFTNERHSGRWDGVLYEWAGKPGEQHPLGDRFHFVMQAPHDVVIAQRHPKAFQSQFNSKINIWWLHDLALGRYGAMAHSHVWNIDRVLTVSSYHKAQVEQVWGLSPESVVATWNGVDYEAFSGINLPYEDREPNTLVFAARPERGLEELVGERGIMERLPNARLYVCGYENTVPEMRAYYEMLWRRCDDLPNVKRMGALGKRELYGLLGRCMVYVYPTTFEDTSCILALEAMAAGMPVVGCRHAAIPETCGTGGSRLVPLTKDGKVDRAGIAHQIRKIIDRRSKWDLLHELSGQRHQSWADAARQWDGLLKSILAEKSQSSEFRLLKHLEHYSDIGAIMHQCNADLDRIKQSLPDFEDNYGFYLYSTYQEHYQAYYAYERARGVNYGPEDLRGNARFEQTASVVEQLKPARVLDYGCAHGHYVMNLLARYPTIRFTGVDIDESNIAKARDWAAKDAPPENMPQFMCAGSPEGIAGQFDLILAAEVLEHVPDPGALVTGLSRLLAPGGTILVTVPYGPWEAAGYQEHKGWRAHIHYFERQDLLELFGCHADYKLLAVPHRGELGHYFLTFRPEPGAACGKVDYARKLLAQAPAETLSVCMIAKDCEYTIGRAIESIRGIADEIIVAVDRTTKDGTAALVERLGGRVIYVDSPLDTGFDAARNASIEQARCDWILWIDDDETLEGVHRLKKYLRANGLNGYALRQHHFSAEPAQLLKTDLPTRLFRNHIGIQFWGVVHEHPERAINQGVGNVYVLPDVDIMHTGYTTEDIRRRRFERNFPLMVRDRQKYPDRKLGKFLMIRDISHLIRYHAEQAAGPGEAQMKYAQVAMALWHDLLEAGETRLIVESLPYLAQSVLILGPRVELAVKLSAVPAGINGGPRLPDEPVRALLPTIEDARKLVAHIAQSEMAAFDQPYF